MPAPEIPAAAAHRKAEHSRFVYSFLPGTLFVLLLWLIFLLSALTKANLAWLGIFPQNFFGLIGVVTGPLIHGDLLHVLSNSFPLVLLSGIILFLHRRVALQVFTFVYVGSGLMTWFIGRHSYHIGASGVVYGLADYLLFQGLFRRDRASLTVALAVLFLYGGLFHGLFPTEERISWEGHVGGFVAGLVAALLYGDSLVHTPAVVATPADQERLLLQQQHLSSTLPPVQAQLPVNYTLATTGSNARLHLRYHLDSRTGIVTYLTHKGASASNKPLIGKTRDGRTKPTTTPGTRNKAE